VKAELGAVAQKARRARHPDHGATGGTERVVDDAGCEAVGAHRFTNGEGGEHIAAGAVEDNDDRAVEHRAETLRDAAEFVRVLLRDLTVDMHDVDGVGMRYGDVGGARWTRGRERHNEEC
jgi:hypothetical protein